MFIRAILLLILIIGITIAIKLRPTQNEIARYDLYPSQVTAINSHINQFNAQTKHDENDEDDEDEDDEDDIEE